MIYLEHDQLEIRCPEVHDRARCSISFQRTLRIPDDGRDHPLPPGLDCFPLRHLDDYADRLPNEWVRRGGVIMPLGEGYTVEEQLTGSAQHGGLQITAYPMKAERYEAMRNRRYEDMDMAPMAMQSPQEEGMGLAPGGRMRQEIYEDDYGLDAWDQRHAVRCFITIANSAQWMAITGERPPIEPPPAEVYTEAGLPWYDYYDADHETVSGSDILKSVKSVTQTGKEKGETALPDNDSINGARVVSLRDTRKRKVREYSVSESLDS